MHTLDKPKLIFKVIFLTSGIFVGSIVDAQNNTFPTTGNAGMGTTSPVTKLHLVNNTTTLSNSNFITIDNRGNNAAYTTTHVIGGVLFAGYRDIRNPANIAGIWAVRTAPASGLASYGDLVFGASNNNGTNITTDNVLPTERMRILSNGNVLIGQSTQTSSAYLLDVNGTIRGDQVVVNTSGADYVFDSSYQLPSLRSVENYVNTYHHLEHIPSAKEMQDNGLRLGDNQILLLKKIEELTLYVIDQNKKQEQQQAIIDKQNKLLQEQQEMLSKMQEEITRLKNK